MNSNKNQANIIDVKPMGGLANRMRCIMSAYALACDCGKSLRVIWYPLPELNADFSDIFMSDNLPFFLHKCNFLAFWLKYCDPRKKNLYLSKFYQKSHYDLCVSDCNDSTLAINDNQKEFCEKAKHAQQCLMSSGLEFYDIPDELYKTIFFPSIKVQKYIDDMCSGFSESTIGVHIRRTDNAESILHSPFELFVKRIEEEMSLNPGSTFYVASDDINTKNELIKLFGERIITHDVRLNRNNREAIIQATAEMFALSKTKKIIGSHYSSFSEMAAKIGGIDLEQLYK